MHKHPAKYSDAVLEAIAEWPIDAKTVLDPFGGTGKVGKLRELGVNAEFTVVELEPEWLEQAPEGVHQIQGDATDLPFEDHSFDAVITSPCYGNRMADHHEARDDSQRNTYRHSLGRPLHPNNAGQLQWGAEYRALHKLAWLEVYRVLKPGGIFVLNISDHVRQGKRQLVTSWHLRTLLDNGFTLVAFKTVVTPRQRYGANSDLRVEHENLLLLVK